MGSHSVTCHPTEVILTPLSQRTPVLIYRLSLAGYIKMVYPQTVTHPSINRARCRVTTLIETNALPLSQATTFSWSRDSFFKVLVLDIPLIFGHKISVNKWRRKSVGRGRHKVLFSNLCCVLIVESLNSDQLYLDQIIVFMAAHYVSNDCFNQSVMELCFGFLTDESWSWNSKSWSWF